MSLSVTLAKVKLKCGVTHTDFDAAITDLLADWLPAIEYALTPEALASGDTGLQTTLNLGACELVAGELLAQLLREPGYAETIEAGAITLRPFAGVSPGDPSGLKAQGAARLSPYLRSNHRLISAGGVATGDKPEEEPW